MTETNIGTLALKLEASDPNEARRLAERIASGLDRLSLTEDRDVVTAKVDSTAGASREQLADRILAELIRQLERK